MKKILITGVSGHIGRHLAPLVAQGYSVYGASRTAPAESLPIRHVVLDLTDDAQVTETVRTLRPDVLLHFAWLAHAPTYLDLPAHDDWERASSRLFQEFCEQGGSRAIFAGSVYEKTLPGCRYSCAKTRLCERVFSHASAGGVSIVWCRVHGTYGPHDPAHKLIPSVINSFRSGAEFRIENPSARRDYLHVFDVASAVNALLESDFHGMTDIASGESITLQALYELIRTLVERPSDGRLVSEKAPVVPTVPAIDREPLDRIGWQPKFGIFTGLKQTIDWCNLAFSRSE